MSYEHINIIKKLKTSETFIHYDNRKIDKIKFFHSCELTMK